MHIRVSVMNVGCIRVSRGLRASWTRSSWNRMSSSPTSGGVVAFEDLVGGGTFDRFAGQIHVANVLGCHVDDEQAAVANRDEEALLGQPLHPLSEWAAADPEFAGEVCL